jgi:hypothetical protein
MSSDPTRVYQGSGGSYNFNLSYPPNLSPESDIIASAMYNEWALTPERDNDGTPDTVITDLGTTPNVATVINGAPFLVGHLVRFSGNTAPANNLIATCTTGSATVPAFSGATFTADPAPAANSRMKVIGFQGAAADIAATTAGLSSTVLDFTTLGLQVGQTLKIGNGAVAGEKFATAALNVYVTVVSVAAHLLTLGNKPAGWVADPGTGKTITVYYGDFIKNGILVSTTRVCGTLEEGYLGQATPAYRVGRGMTVDTLTFDFKHKGRVECVANFVGQGGTWWRRLGSYSIQIIEREPIAQVNVPRLRPGGGWARPRLRRRQLFERGRSGCKQYRAMEWIELVPPGHRCRQRCQ